VSRLITTDDLPDIARGCSVLGAGGGGEAYTSTLMATQAIADHGPVRLVTYDELPADGIVMACGFLGAPTVTIEKLSNGNEGAWLREEVERHRGAPVVALVCAEIGGSNGTRWPEGGGGQLTRSSGDGSGALTSRSNSSSLS